MQESEGHCVRQESAGDHLDATSRHIHRLSAIVRQDMDAWSAVTGPADGQGQEGHQVTPEQDNEHH